MVSRGGIKRTFVSTNKHKKYPSHWWKNIPTAWLTTEWENYDKKINFDQSKFKNLSNATSILIQTGIKNSIDEINLNLHHIFKSNFMDFFNKMSFFLDQYNSVLFRKRISSEFIIDRNKNFFGEIVVVSQRGLIRIKKSDGTYEDFHENEIKMKF